MAIELLVRTKYGPGGRARGDIVSVKSVPNRGWGKGEDLPNYLIIRIDDTDKTGFKKYEGRHVKLDPIDDKSPSKRSKYRLNLDILPKDYAKKRPHLTLTKSIVISDIILNTFKQWQQK